MVQGMFKEFFSIFRPGGHYVGQSKTICAILVEGTMGNYLVKLF